MRYARPWILILAGPILIVTLFMFGGTDGDARAQSSSDRDAATPPPTVAPTPAVEDVQPEPREEQSVVQGARSEAATASLAPAQPVTVTLVGDDDPAAVSQFLRYALAGYGLQSSMVTITVGALPAGLPITLTLPEDATVLGGTVQRGEYESSQLLISSTGTLDELSEDLGQDLMAQGYHAPASTGAGMGRQVFLSQPTSMPEVFCSPDDRYSVYQVPLAVAGEPSALRLTMNRISPVGGICSQDGSRVDQTYGILPQLAPPADAQIRSTGTGGGSNSVSADAEIHTSLNASELAEHYMEQLEAAGWEQLDAATADPMSWSGWRFVDEQDRSWAATFYIVQLANAPDTYAATLRADLLDQ